MRTQRGAADVISLSTHCTCLCLCALWCLVYTIWHHLHTWATYPPSIDERDMLILDLDHVKCDLSLHHCNMLFPHCSDDVCSVASHKDEHSHWYIDILCQFPMPAYHRAFECGSSSFSDEFFCILISVKFTRVLYSKKEIVIFAYKASLGPGKTSMEQS